MPPPDHDPVRDDADSFEEGEEEDAAALETEADVTCPHCGETMTITLDPGGGRAQEYVEDCQVCCRPWRGRVWDDAPRGAGGQLLPLEELLPPRGGRPPPAGITRVLHGKNKTPKTAPITPPGPPLADRQAG